MVGDCVVLPVATTVRPWTFDAFQPSTLPANTTQTAQVVPKLPEEPSAGNMMTVARAAQPVGPASLDDDASIPPPSPGPTPPSSTGASSAPSVAVPSGAVPSSALPSSAPPPSPPVLVGHVMPAPPRSV